MTILTLTTLTTFLASLLTLSIAHANMALPSINRSLDHILVRLFTLGIAYEINIALRSFWSFGHLVKIVFDMEITNTLGHQQASLHGSCSFDDFIWKVCSRKSSGQIPNKIAKTCTKRCRTQTDYLRIVYAEFRA